MQLPTFRLVLFLVVLIASPDTYAARNEAQPIGIFTTVEGAVAVQHTGAGRPHRAKYQDHVILKDVIETDPSAYAKALLEDDTLLSVAENSRVEITEYVYNPSQNFRSTIVHLAQGTVRALVGGVFKAPGSRFEVHTTTAIAAARGTYFIVWVEGDRTTGMANIGDTGDVAFTAGGDTIIVKPGYYSIAVPGAAPSPPALMDPKVPEVRRAVEVTDLRDSANDESVKTVLSHHAPDVTLPTTQPLLWADRNVYASVSGSDGTSSTRILGGILTSGQTVAGVNSTVTTIGQAVGSSVGQVGSALGSTVTGVGSSVGQIGGALGSTVTGVGSTLGQIVGALGSTVTGVGSTVGQLGAALGPTVTGIGSAVGQIGASLSPTVTGIGSTVTAVAPVLSPTVTAIGSTVPAITAPVVTTVGSVVTPVTTTVTSAVSATLVPATSILGKLK